MVIYASRMRRPPYVLSVPDNGQGTLTGHCPRCGFAGSFKGSLVVGPNSANRTFAMMCLHCGGMVMVDANVTMVHAATNHAPIRAVYPPTPRTFPHEDFDAVPTELQSGLGETYRAFEAGAYTLTGLGCRMVLERLVQGKGYRDERGLEERLESLKATYPDLVAPLANADVIRKVGNAAAHDAFRDLTRGEAEAVIEFTEEVLRAFYIAPKKRERMAKAFERKAAPAKS